MAASGDERPPPVRRAAGADDARSAGELLDRFNREFDTPSPGPAFLAERLQELDGEGCAVFLARENGVDVGIAVVRFRPALWSAGPEAYLAELYVAGEHRRSGLGAALLEAVLALSRERGCEWIELGTDEGDADAHRLYERFGFSNFADRDAPESGRERMYVYERAL